MEIMTNNHLIYTEIFDNLEEGDLYKLWNINFFRESVQDYLMISKKIIWELFVENFKLDSEFIEIFNDKLNTKCCLCERFFKLKDCRTIKEYQYCTFEFGSEFKYCQICKDCDKYCKITKQDCTKCEGSKINGVMIATEEDDCSELHQRTIHFVCCPPTHKILCVCNHDYSQENSLFCLNHKMKSALTNCNCEIICEECYDNLDE